MLRFFFQFKFHHVWEISTSLWADNVLHVLYLALCGITFRNTVLHILLRTISLGMITAAPISDFELNFVHFAPLVLFLLLFQEKLFPAVYIHWKKYQSKLLMELNSLGEKLVITGDARHDSMGHSAKYGIYSIFCCNKPSIAHFELVQVYHIWIHICMHFSFL